MKRLIFTYLLAVPVATCQNTLHLTVPPLHGSRVVELSALNIERGNVYPSVIQLRGNVEIKTPVCLPVGKRQAMICDGEMILRADEAEFHEESGQIEAHGNVSVTPLRHRTGKK